MEPTQLSRKILDWLRSQPLLPPDSKLPISSQLDGGKFFTVIAGVRPDFKELKIHLAVYPEYFAPMTYAKSQIFGLENLFNPEVSRSKRIESLGETLREVSLNYKHPVQSNCVPYILVVEEEESPEPFYETEIFPCGLSGTTEEHFDSAYIGIESTSLRHEIVLVGDQNIVAVSIDHADLGAVEAAGLKEEYHPVDFGCVTYISPRHGLILEFSHERLRIKIGEQMMYSWGIDHPFLW